MDGLGMLEKMGVVLADSGSDALKKSNEVTGQLMGNITITMGLGDITKDADKANMQAKISAKRLERDKTVGNQSPMS